MTAAGQSPRPWGCCLIGLRLASNYLFGKRKVSQNAHWHYPGYVIAIVGLALIVAGAWDIYLLYTEQTFEITLSDYASPTRTIAGGIAMIGLAQALRLLVAINRRLMGRPGGGP